MMVTIDEISRAVTAAALFGAFIVGAGTLVVSILSFRRTGRLASKVEQVGAKVEDVQKQTDGINEHLVKVHGEAERAKGVLEGKATEKARENERKVAAANPPPPAERQ